MPLLLVCRLARAEVDALCPEFCGAARLRRATGLAGNRVHEVRKAPCGPLRLLMNLTVACTQVSARLGPLGVEARIKPTPIVALSLAATIKVRHDFPNIMPMRVHLDLEEEYPCDTNAEPE